MRHAQMRALAKAVSWRLLGTLATTAAVLAFTGRWVLALSIGGVEGVVKIGLYFIHERLWDRIAFGRHSAGGPGGERGAEGRTARHRDDKCHRPPRAGG